MLAIAASVDWGDHPTATNAEVLIKAYRGQVIGRRLDLAELAAGRCRDCRPDDLMPGVDWTSISDAASVSSTAAIGDATAWSRWGGIDSDDALIQTPPPAIGVFRLAELRPPADPMTLMPVYLRKSAAEEQTPA